MRVKRAKRTAPALSAEAQAMLNNPTRQTSLTPAMWELVMAGHGVATMETGHDGWLFERRAASTPA
jgi:hypothetical protein